MSENILNDFMLFLEKSATVIGGQPDNASQGTVLSGKDDPREGKVDVVNNTMAPGVKNPSHGGAEGMPLKAQPLKPVSWNS
jgi:hypothetical protein